MFCQNCGSEVGSNEACCARCVSSQRIDAGASGVSQVTTTPAPTTYVPAPGGQAHTSRWIGQGWELVQSDLGNFILMAFVMMAVSGSVPLILQGAMYAGFQGVCKKKLQGQKIELGDLFQGFQFFVPTLKAHLVLSILIFFALLFFI